MLVRAGRTLPTWVLRAWFYAGLFFLVVLVHLGLTGALRQHGLNGGVALFLSGTAVLALVLVLIQLADWVREGLQEYRQMQRFRLRLPAGPCCIIWPPNSSEYDSGPAMPWSVSGPMRARYPGLPRRLGIEGYAIAEFEVGANGRAKNIYLVDAWPSDVFFVSAKEALQHARFEPSGDEHVRFGASYRMPFVFRLPGSIQLKEKGPRARRLRPILHATQRLVGNLAAQLAEMRARPR